mgnify:CR=1 FL=1
MANYVKFKQGLKKDFNTTNQPLTNGMIYFVIDENNHGSIYYDTVVDGAQATKKGTVHRVKFSGLPVQITGSVTGTGVISDDGESIVINTSTNHSHGLAHQDFTVLLSSDDTNLKWTRLGNQNGEGFWLKSIRGNDKAPAWFQPDYSAGIAFGGADTKGIISVRYQYPSVRFAGGNGNAPVWYFTITGANDKTYDLSKIGGHSSDSAKLDHNVTFKIASTADSKNGGNGTVTDLSGPAVNLYLPTRISGFDLLQATRFQGTADNADTVDYFHMAEEKYKYETTQNRPTAGADWCIKISTPVWNSTSETIYLTAEGDNTHGTVILKTGSRQNNWWGYATNYNGTGIIGVYKLVSDSDDVYIKVNSAYTSVRIRTTFKPTISIPTAIPDYKFTSVPWQGGFFSNAIYTDTLTFTTPKYWANIPISDSVKTDTQPTFNTAYVSNWWRSTGNTGWWNETHHGGITMEDDSYVKVAGNKNFLIPNGSLKIGGNGNIFFATGNDDATLKIYGQTNTKYGLETIAIQTCFDNEDPQTSEYTTQYADRCNLLLQPKGGQVYIGKNLTTPGDTGYKLFVDGNQWTSGSQWVNGSLFFTDITGNTANTGTSLKGIYGRIGGNDGWRIAGGARANNAGYLEIATCDDMNEPIYVRQYGGGGDWNGYVSLARTFTLLDAAGRSRAPELFEAKKIHVNSLLDQSVAIADIGYQFQVTGTSNFTDNVDISGVTTHHNNIQIDTNYSIARPGKSSAWYGSHNNAMIRMTSVNSWSPLLAQKVTNGYWVLGHYDYNNEKNKNDDFRDQWVFGYLADSNLEGTTGASNSLSTTYRLLNIGGGFQRMFVSATYNATVGSGTQPVYVQSNGNVATCSYSLSATIEAGTANRMAYYKTANQIGSSGHYVTSSQVGINASSSKDYTFYVGGTSLLDNAVTINGNLHIIPDTDVGLNAAGSLVIGNKSGQNMGLDGNEIMARNNSKASALYLNNEGGIVQVGQDGITIQAKASSTNLQSGGLRISSENAGNSGNVALELYRGNNGSWQIANEGAILYFRTNWVSEKKTTYAKNALIIDHTTGAASLPFLAIGQEARNTTYGLYVVSNQSWIKNTLWAGNILPDKNNNVDNNLGSSQWRWGSLHIYRNFNIYGNESTTDESHIKFNASDNTQRAIITFNGNVNNGAQSDTHLKIATSYGAIKIKPANGYLDLGSGNDLHIQANTKSFNQDIVAAYDAPGGGYGIDLVIGGGATTIVGAGESAAAMRSVGASANENLYLTADANVFLYSNCDTIGNRRYVVFDTSRNFYPDADSSGSIGVSNKRWNNGYFNYLNIRGNCSADMAYSTTNPKIIFSDGNGAQAVGIVYTDTDVYRPTKGLKIMDVNNDDAGNVWFEVQGDIWTGGNIRINSNKSLIQNQSDTSNYTEIVKWYKGGKSQNTYDPQIGQHNTGNNGTGSICILPYATATAPWSGSVGLFIAKSKMLLDNYRVPTTGNSGGTVGSASVPVYSDNGVLKTITSYSGNAATATTASKLSKNAGSATKPVYFSGGVPVQCNDTLGVSISGNAASATYTTQLLGVQNNSSNTPYSAIEGNLIRAVWSVKGDNRWYLKAGSYNCRVNYADNAENADIVDGYHASEVYKAATYTINNYSSVNDWVRIATINIGGTDLAMGGFTAILSNRECLDSSSFILTVAIRRNSTTSVSCQSFYTPIGSASPRQIIVRSNDGVNFYVYFKSELNAWTTYYNVTKIMTENKVTFENAGVSSANLIAGSVLNVTATRGGYVNRAVDADNAKKVWNDSSYMSFHWNGQSGQPTWLWGGNNSTDMYVYNPSNFKVSYANKAGDADTVDGYHASDLAKKTDVSNSYVKKAGDTMTGELKNSSNDFTLSSDSNEQRFKFLNASKNKHTVYFYKGAGTSSTIVGLWDSTDGQIWTYNTSGYFNLGKRVVIGGYNNSSYSLSTSSFICDSWIRTTGSTGWYNETYGGGWYMSDNTYIRNYNSKHLYITGKLGVNCELRLWEAGRQITRAGNSVAWINGRDGALIRQDSYTGYNPIFSCKTTNGSWELGPYDNNILYFAYGTDSNHKAGNNSVEHPLRLMPGKGVLLSGLNYGTSLPSSGTNGQVFFKI